MRRFGPLLVGVLGCAGCGGGAGHADARDAAVDAFVLDDAIPPRDGAPLTSVDFTASGCALTETPSGDAGAPSVRCEGPAALAVAFAGLATAEVETWAWTFGDGGASAEAAPVHTYGLPGSYDVTVSAAGPGGTATTIRSGYVVVVPAALGAACSTGAQCATADCEADLCTASCASTPCAIGACAQLGGPWAGPRCVQTCASDGECGAGRQCQVVADDEGGWIRGCLPGGALAELGASCDDASGAAIDGACASGACLAIGARGACVIDCASAACPDGSACATFGNGTAACVPSCDGAHPCSDDPWIACEAAGATGPWGFTLVGAGAVCAPRSCGDASDCPGGACVLGHCTGS